MTNAYNLIDIVIRTRKRPSSTSTYASITRPVFGDSPVKDLPIPTGINAYNHYMGSVDTANRYRADFTTLRPKNYRYWKPLFHWLLDIVLTNSYLLAKASRRSRIGESKGYYTYRRFLEALAKALMMYSESPEHNQIYRSTRAYCVYCRKNQFIWEPKHEQQEHQRRSFGIDITNIGGGSGGRFRGSKTQWGCDQCDIPLCKIGDCWRLWHAKFN